MNSFNKKQYCDINRGASFFASVIETYDLKFTLTHKSNKSGVKTYKYSKKTKTSLYALYPATTYRATNGNSKDLNISSFVHFLSQFKNELLSDCLFPVCMNPTDLSDENIKPPVWGIIKFNKQENRYDLIYLEENIKTELIDFKNPGENYNLIPIKHNVNSQLFVYLVADLFLQNDDFNLNQIQESVDAFFDFYDLAAKSINEEFCSEKNNKMFALKIREAVELFKESVRRELNLSERLINYFSIYLIKNVVSRYLNKKYPDINSIDIDKDLFKYCKSYKKAIEQIALLNAKDQTKFKRIIVSFRLELKDAAPQVRACLVSFLEDYYKFLYENNSSLPQQDDDGQTLTLGNGSLGKNTDVASKEPNITSQ